MVPTAAVNLIARRSWFIAQNSPQNTYRRCASTGCSFLIAFKFFDTKWRIVLKIRQACLSIDKKKNKLLRAWFFIILKKRIRRKQKRNRCFWTQDKFSSIGKFDEVTFGWQRERFCLKILSLLFQQQHRNI